MSLIRTMMLTCAATALLGATAQASDLITVPTSTPVEMPLYDAPSTDWTGFYAGVFGGVQNGEASGAQYGGGIVAGVNAQFDFYLVGTEVAVQGLTGDVGNTSYGQILGRAGLVVTDDVVVYAAGGYGIDLGAPEESDALVGGGVEMALSESVSVRAQYLHGFPVSGDNPKDQFSLGANFHF